MVQYLKIASTSTTNPVDMFTLGVSTARGVDGKIGQFGSGSLMSTLLWLRLTGESPVFMLNGVTVTFESRPERTTTGGVFHRVYQSVDGVETPLSVALEYGELDWTEAHMALREWVSNALDQGADIETGISKVDNLVCDADQVCVFVPMTSEVRKYWQHIDQYFLHFRQLENTVCIPKAKVSACRVYRKGVFVRELPHMKTLHDYNFEFDINECRTGSSDSMEYKITQILHGDHSPGFEFLHSIFSAVCAGVECWEVKNPTSYPCGQWYQYLVGDQVKGVKLVKNNSKREGTGFAIDSVWYEGFVKRNPELSGYADLFSEKQGIIEEPASQDLRLNAHRCWEFLTSLISTSVEMPSIHAFKTLDGGMPSYLGRYDKDKHRVFIWHDQTASRQTMLEELAHAISGQGDCTRGFQEYLFRCLTEAMDVIA